MTGLSEKQVTAFFYGSFIRKDVLARVGFAPEKIEVARLDGFDIHISPHAALSPSAQHCVYGILVNITHETLDSLYSMDGVGIFLPQAVIVRDMDGRLLPALCYIPASVGSKAPDLDYLGKLIEAGRAYGFPDWYLEKLSNLRDRKE